MPDNSAWISNRKTTSEKAGSPRKWRKTAARLFFLVFGGFFIFGIINSTLNPPPPETSEQLQTRQRREAARQAAQRQAEEDRLARVARTKILCEAKAECSKYAAARQACATAGSFDTCMNIKTDANWQWMAQNDCTNDGRLISNPVDLPSDFECLFSRLQ
jgi:hypothetical protein